MRFWRVTAVLHRTAPGNISGTAAGSSCGLLSSPLTAPKPAGIFSPGTRRIKGLGYKEASHFLRNIGFPGYAILDKHILNSLREMGVIGKRMRSAYDTRPAILR